MDIMKQMDFFQLIRSSFHSKGLDTLRQKLIELQCAGDLNFPAKDYINKSTSKEKLKLQLNFMGLLGVDSCMPAYFNDLLNRNEPNANRLKSFLDIFHHRIYELFFYAWLSCQPDIQLELGDNIWLELFEKLTPSFNVKHESLALAKYFIGHKRTLAALTNLLSIKLPNLPFEIQAMQPSWCRMDSDNILGATELELGANMLLGGRYLSGAKQIHIQFGPINETVFNVLKKQKKDLICLIKQYIDIFHQLTMSALVSYQAEALCLGKTMMVLGQTTFLSNKPILIQQPL